MDTQAIVDLINQHKWLALAAVVIGVIVRLLKSDTPLPTVPARWRPWLALGLGVAAGVVDKVAQGARWLPAILGGVLAAIAAMSAHDLLIEGVRAGREPFAKAPGRHSLPPPPPPPAESSPDTKPEGHSVPPATD